jgi:hypothetical protein
MSEAAGQPSERTPDFIPGWFKRVQPGTQRPAAPTLDEAVRVLDDHAGVFPIAFLRSGEFVRPARPPQLGFVIGRMARDIELAVPPGYWLVRGDDGEIVLWRDEDFREKFSRRDDIEWRPAALRQNDFVEDKRGWRGTQPAEGTRRALIYGALLGEEVLTAAEALDHADAIESALLDSTIAAEEQLTAKREELIEVHRFLDELGAPCGPEISSPTVLRRLHALVERSGSFTVGEGSVWPMPPGEYEIRPVRREDVGASEPEPDRPDAEIVDSDGHTLGGLEVVIGAADGVPYVSLADLEHVFANLYEDITDRQARKHRGEASVSGTMAEKVGESTLRDNPYLSDEDREKAEKRLEAARIDEEHRRDNADDRPLWRVELDYGLNHVRNAAAAWLGL